jgi:hypothetical protein
MQKEVTSRRNNRVYDFPERQVGFPERNDVSNPDIEMERIHVDLETMRISKKSAAAISREMSDGNGYRN